MALLTCEIYSNALRMPTSVTVILPHDEMKPNESIRTLYLLHGRSHNHSVWQRYTSLERYCQSKPVAVIMPEVNRSFYINMVYGVDYFTYITEELPALCESMFHIGTTAEHRYIAGMSMGGYGCLKAALSKPEFYHGCAAVSAVTDIIQHIEDTPAETPKGREFSGIFGEDRLVSSKDDLYFLAKQAKQNGIVPQLYFACGAEDHLNQEGAIFRKFLSDQSISFIYEEWPGIHDWNFWDQALPKVLDFILNKNYPF